MKRPIKQVECLKETIDSLEQLGCVVMTPEDLDKDIETLNAIRKRQKEQDVIRQKKIKEESFMPLDISEYDIQELLDSIVPACCKHECMVEPDGTCEHGQPSILLHYGLI